jgi:hypothetical protein
MYRNNEINSMKSTLHALYPTIKSQYDTKIIASYIFKFAIYQTLIFVQLCRQWTQLSHNL